MQVFKTLRMFYEGGNTPRNCVYKKSPRSTFSILQHPVLSKSMLSLCCNVLARGG